MSDNNYLGSVTVRLPISMLQRLDNISGRGKKYRDRSDAIRSLVLQGSQLNDMLEIYNNPAKKQEFEEKLANLLQDKSYEKTLETMTERDLGAIILICQNLQDKKLQQLVLDIKKS